MNYTVETKRVVVLDRDLEGVDMEEWQRIMRHVLGRHYATIKNHEGGGWTFPSHALEIFESMKSALATQTPKAQEQASGSIYRHDIDASLYRLRDQWIQNLDIKEKKKLQKKV